MSTDPKPAWSFLTNHARVLLSIAQDPGIRLREIGDSVGITERAAHRDGRRSHYQIQSNRPLPDSLARGKRVGHLLTVLATQPPRSSIQRSAVSPPPRMRQAG